MILKFKIGPTPVVVNVFEPSGWKYVTSAGWDVSGGFGKVGGGVGVGKFMVQMTRGTATGRKYRLSYIGLEASAGVGLLPVSVSVSTENMDSQSFGPVFRLPGSPDASGEGGPPTGFEGMAALLTLSGGMVATSYGTLMLLGGYQVPFTSITNFKYATVFRGISVGTPGAGGTALLCNVCQIDPVSS